MTGYATWLSPSVMRLIAWALLHFLWQGMVLAAVFAALMSIVRSAATRYAISVSILILMVSTDPFRQDLEGDEGQNAATGGATSFLSRILPTSDWVICHSYLRSSL